MCIRDSLSYPGNNSGRQADHHLEGEGEEGKSDCERQPIAHEFADRAAAEIRTEVTLKYVPDVDRVLRVERLVEVIALLERLDHLGCERLVTRKRADRVTRHHEHKKEDQEGRSEDCLLYTSPSPRDR